MGKLRYPIKKLFRFNINGYQMPNKNGYEAATEIRAIETSSKTPIIAVTAGILIGEKEKCFDSGMDDYMPKHYNR
jgi:CheY-like chemotaxis protein